MVSVSSFIPKLGFRTKKNDAVVGSDDNKDDNTINHNDNAMSIVDRNDLESSFRDDFNNVLLVNRSVSAPAPFGSIPNVHAVGPTLNVGPYPRPYPGPIGPRPPPGAWPSPLGAPRGPGPGRTVGPLLNSVENRPMQVPPSVSVHPSRMVGMPSSQSDKSFNGNPPSGGSLPDVGGSMLDHGGGTPLVRASQLQDVGMRPPPPLPGYGPNIVASQARQPGGSNNALCGQTQPEQASQTMVPSEITGKMPVAGPSEKFESEVSHNETSNSKRGNPSPMPPPSSVGTHPPRMVGVAPFPPSGGPLPDVGASVLDHRLGVIPAARVPLAPYMRSPPAPSGYASQLGPPNIVATHGGQLGSCSLHGQMSSLQMLPNGSMSQMPLAGPSESSKSEVPHPTPSSSVIVYETCNNKKKGIPPPPATSEYIVKDTGNCSPRYMRCTLNQIPCTSELLKLSALPLSLMVQPLALPHPAEEPIQVVDFGENGPIRCYRCRAYMNPFMKFIDQGRRFICNFCRFINETPPHYYCKLGYDGRRMDADERPELCKGSVEFVATREYMIHEARYGVYFFLIDISRTAIETGATAAACSAVKQVLADLPEGPRKMVGVATYDNSVHFYKLKHSLQQMLIVPDVEDVYAPLHSDIIVDFSECHQHLGQLLDNIPIMFNGNHITDSAFGAAIKAAFLLMKSSGGKLLIFQSVLPSVGIGALSARGNECKLHVSSENKDIKKLLQPADQFLNTMASELAKHQVCVDVFITTQTYIDIASINVIPKTTGGQTYFYFPFSVPVHSVKLYNDLMWNIKRPQGFDAVMCVRCSEGLQVEEYSGNFYNGGPVSIDIAGIDCDKTIEVSLKHDGQLQDGSEGAFQCALVYTTTDGQRRIRVHTLSLPCTTDHMNVFVSADIDAHLSCLLKQVAKELPTSSALEVRKRLSDLCIDILHSYHKFCAKMSLDGHLFFPESLKLLPLYILGLSKSRGLQTVEWVDQKSYWISRVSWLSTPLAVPLVYPRMMAIHRLLSQDADGSATTPTVSLSTEFITEDGIYLLENGEDALIYIGDRVDAVLLKQLFGVSLADICTQFMLQQYDNPLSKKLNDLIHRISCLRSCYLSLRFCKKGDPSEMIFKSYMVEDWVAEEVSYGDFLSRMQKQVHAKMLNWRPTA